MTIFLIFAAMAALYLIWLAFRAATFALPLYAGLSIAVAMTGRGYGHGAAILAGAVAGIVILVAGRLIAALVPSDGVRVGIAALFAIPAGFAGYQLAYGLGRLLIDPNSLLVAASAITALVVGASAASALILPPETKGRDALPAALENPEAEAPAD